MSGEHFVAGLDDWTGGAGARIYDLPCDMNGDGGPRAYIQKAHEYEWDAAKAAANLANHRVSFDVMRASTRHVVTDPRHTAEHRLIAYGPTGTRLHTCIFTMRGERVRMKSNNREIKRYEEARNAEDQDD